VKAGFSKAVRAKAEVKEEGKVSQQVA
jgi:hypothetical protein